MERIYLCYASSAFGLEGLVSAELKRLGASGVLAENGGVRFCADGNQLQFLNLMMHFSDRLYIVLDSRKCKTFDELFNLVNRLPWEEYFTGNESIDVSCKCTRSTLMSPRDCQSITKKAIIENLRCAGGYTIFPESGSSLPVHLTIRNDVVSVMVNTSGSALSRRGYRTWNGEAPLRETLAAALVELSGWKPGRPLHDPCCGTGTILTEAAFMAAGRAPGLHRSFAMESFACFRNIDFSAIRNRTAIQEDVGKISGISGSDINPEALELAHRHLVQADIGSADRISLSCVPLQKLNLEAENGVFICNPPYGERLGDQQHCRKLYHELYRLRQRHPSWQLCAISSDPAFERCYGKRADKKRRLYNGRLECVYYIYY